ncbi:hypothetical protein DZF91_06800, partial [Actinomadura logoneensis]
VRADARNGTGEGAGHRAGSGAGSGAGAGRGQGRRYRYGWCGGVRECRPGGRPWCVPVGVGVPGEVVVDSEPFGAHCPDSFVLLPRSASS